MNVVIAGGGTGGHLFPGIAIAQEFMRHDPQTHILFLGSSQGIETRVLPTVGFPLKTLCSRGVRGKKVIQQGVALAAVLVACCQALGHLGAARADIVLGLGGYSSFPAVVAAWVMGIPAAIHEQNSVPGLANRILARIVQNVFVSFEESSVFFPRSKTIVTGLPVRQAFSPQPLPPRGRFCLLVCGGSQGAHALNCAMAAALPHLSDCADRLWVLHQAGRDDAEMLRQQYAACGITAEVKPFVDDMASWYRQAHLVVSRAGASTLAELALCGRASLLVPYPFAAGNHQERNAQVFAERGASQVVLQQHLTGEQLAKLLRKFIDDPERCATMGRNALTLAKPQAAADIVAACYRMVKKAG